jgi:hypothetical protein
MQAWTVIIGDAAQTDLPGQRIKSSMDFSTVQTTALAGNEQIRGDRPAFPMTFAPRDVIGKYLAGRRVQRHEARLAEFAVADRQQRHRKVHVPEFEIARFTET